MIRERQKVQRTTYCDIPGCQARHDDYISADANYGIDCPDGWRWVMTDGEPDPTKTLYLCPEHSEHVDIVRLIVKLTSGGEGEGRSTKAAP